MAYSTQTDGSCRPGTVAKAKQGKSPVDPGPEEQQDIQRLNTILARSDIRDGELWLYYFSIGGSADEYEVEEHLHGLTSLPKLERELLEYAAHEINTDQPQLTARDEPTSAS